MQETKNAEVIWLRPAVRPVPLVPLWADLYEMIAEIDRLESESLTLSRQSRERNRQAWRLRKEVNTEFCARSQRMFGDRFDRNSLEIR